MNIKKTLDKPIFIISLDVELIWGYVSDLTHRGVRLMKKDNRKVRDCIDILLNLFEKHNISATWAVVGHLFLDYCECADGIQHKDMPRFKDDWYSADPCTDIKRDPLYYGRDIQNHNQRKVFIGATCIKSGGLQCLVLRNRVQIL